MTDLADAPAIWVGCLGCYNAGKLHGNWIILVDDGQAMTADELSEKLDELFERDERGFCACGGPHDRHEELWVMDHQRLGIGGECAPHEAIPYADLVAEFGNLGALVLKNTAGDLESARHYLEECYCGEYESLEDYVLNCEIYDLVHEDKPGGQSFRVEDLRLGGYCLSGLIDWKGLARTLDTEGFFTIKDSKSHNVHVFSPW